MIQNTIKIVSPGVTVTTGSTSATVAIPNTSAGTPAKVIRCICHDAATYAYVMPGNSSVSVTGGANNGNGILINANEGTLLDVSGCTYLAYLQGDAASYLNITPVEWF